MILIHDEVVVAWSTLTLKSEEWMLFPTHLGRRMAKIRIGRVPPEWLVAAVLSDVK